MKRKLFLLLAIAAMAVSSCKEHGTPVNAQASIAGTNFNLEFLFEVDGCKVYRFYDARTVYFTNCQGKVSSDYDVHRSKGGTTHHYEETLNAGR